MLRIIIILNLKTGKLFVILIRIVKQIQRKRQSSTSSLSLDGIITDTLKQNYGSTLTSVGTVSVTLSDCGIAN